MKDPRLPPRPPERPPVIVTSAEPGIYLLIVEGPGDFLHGAPRQVRATIDPPPAFDVTVPTLPEEAGPQERSSRDAGQLGELLENPVKTRVRGPQARYRIHGMLDKPWTGWADLIDPGQWTEAMRDALRPELDDDDS